MRSEQMLLQGQWQWDMQSDAVYCSDVMSFPPDFEGTKSIVHPEDAARVQRALKLVHEGETISLSFRIITTYGEVKTITGEGISINTHPPLLPPEREIEPWEAACAHRRYQQEEAHLQQRRDLADTAERLHGLGTWYINTTTHETYYSDNVFRIHGLPAQSLNAHANTFNTFIHPEDSMAVTDALERGYKHQLPVHLEYRMIRPSGEVRYLMLITEWRHNKSGQPLFTGVLQDVTELRAGQEQQQGSEIAQQFQRSVLHFNEQQTNSGNWYVNLFTRKITYSDNYFRLYGLKQQALPNQSVFLNLVHPDDRDTVAKAIDRMYHEHVLPELEYRITRPDGKTRHLRHAGKLLILGKRELMLVGTVQDVTLERGLEKKMQEQAEKAVLQQISYDQAEEEGGTGWALWYLSDGAMHWSHGLYKLLGYKQDAIEPTQRQLLRSVYPDDLKSFKEALALVLNGQPHDPLFLRIISRGGISHVKLSFRHVLVNERPAVAGAMQDVTQLINLQQQLAERIRFAELLNTTIQDSVIVTNTEHAITSWNWQAEHKTGIKAAEALHENIFDLLPRLKEEGYQRLLQQVLNGVTRVLSHAQDGYQKGYYHLHLTPLRDESGLVHGVLHVVRDTSREQQLQLHLSERLNFIESLVEASVDRILVMNRHMNYLYCNQKAADFYGLRKQDIIGKNVLEVFPASINDPTYNHFRRALRGDTVHIPAIENISEEHYFEVFLIPIKDETGAVSAVLWIHHDLSAEIKIQKQLRKSDEILNTISAAFIELDSDYQFKYINPTAEKMLPRKREELLGKQIWEVFPEAVSQKEYDAIIKANTENVKVEVEYLSAIYNRWIFMSVVPAVDGVVLFQYDRQDIREAQEKLQEEHRCLKEAQAVGRVGSFEWEVGSPVSQWSDELYRINGLAPQSDAATLQVSIQFVHPDDKQMVKKAKADSLKKPGRYGLMHRILLRNSEVRWINQQWESLANESGRVWKVRGVVQDITEQRLAEEELLRIKDELAQQANDKYLSLFNSIDEAFALCEIVTDEHNKAIDYRLLELNPAFEKMTGITIKAAKGRTARELVPNIEDWWIETYAKVAFEGESIRFENRVAELDMWFNVYASPIGIKREGQFTLVYTNITERKRHESHLAFLAEVSQELVPRTDFEETMNSISEKIGRYLEGAVTFSEINEEEQTVTVHYAWSRPDMPVVKGIYPFLDYFTKDFLQAAREDKVYVYRDRVTEVTSNRERTALRLARSFVSVPLIRNGEWLFQFTVADSVPRDWRTDEIELIKELMARMWMRLERAHAEEALRKNEDAGSIY